MFFAGYVETCRSVRYCVCFFWGVFWQICDTPAASLEMIFFLEAERSETQTHPMPQDPSEVIQEKKQFTFPWCLQRPRGRFQWRSVAVPISVRSSRSESGDLKMAQLPYACAGEDGWDHLRTRKGLEVPEGQQRTRGIMWECVKMGYTAWYTPKWPILEKEWCDEPEKNLGATLHGA